MEGSIPEEVRQFVGKYIRSLDQLEVLLLVGALPDRQWSVEDVYNVVRSSPAVVADRLESLVNARILSRNGQPPVYQYQPKDEGVAHAISALGATYKLSRHRIVELIYAPTRTEDALTTFTEAFRFKRKD
ncbi:MAG TPA: hypothetical protein VNT99_06325 [Methylomirabilota bacterium]|nr:hypothetical protein [Methylomirabilota bacterium]